MNCLGVNKKNTSPGRFFYVMTIVIINKCVETKLKPVVSFFCFPVTAYKDKIKEMSMLSLLCSCFYTQPHPNSLYQYGGPYAHRVCLTLWFVAYSAASAFVTCVSILSDLEVKSLNKRASGQSFEVILKDPAQSGPVQPQPLPSPPKKDVSLEELQKRLEAAEERRKVSRCWVIVCMLLEVINCPKCGSSTDSKLISCLQTCTKYQKKICVRQL